MTILNLTQHVVTPDQYEQGVIEPKRMGFFGPAKVKELIKELLTFDSLPSHAQIEEVAGALALMATENGAKRAMIGGAPFLMAPLEQALLNVGVEPVYAFSVRDSTEQVQPDGSVRKVNTFSHAGFVRPHRPKQDCPACTPEEREAWEQGFAI